MKSFFQISLVGILCWFGGQFGGDLLHVGWSVRASAPVSEQAASSDSVVAAPKPGQKPGQKNAQKPFKLAILDIDRVIRDAAVSVYIKKTVEERRSALQKDVEVYEKELRKEAETLKELENKHDPAFQAAQKAFEEKVKDVKKRLRGREKILAKAFHGVRLKVVQHIMSLVADLAESEGITLVLPKNVVMYQEEGYEITNIILERLNKDIPIIEIKLPDGV